MVSYSTHGSSPFWMFLMTGVQQALSVHYSYITFPLLSKVDPRSTLHKSPISIWQDQDVRNGWMHIIIQTVIIGASTDASLLGA